MSPPPTTVSSAHPTSAASTPTPPAHLHSGIPHEREKDSELNPLIIMAAQSFTGNGDESGRGGGQQLLDENTFEAFRGMSETDGGEVVTIMREKNVAGHTILHYLKKLYYLVRKLHYFIHY